MNQTQIIDYLSGEQKMELAFIMSDFVKKTLRQNIKKELGRETTKKQIVTELQKRLKKLSEV